MTQEEKELLLKDLCARLPYHPKAKIFIEGFGMEYNEQWTDIELGHAWFESETENIKPYLRPMSSMTKEERYTYRHMLGATLNSEGESIMFVYVEDFPTVIDWLNEHHFDYRGLIEKGLALEAPEDMYII